jgi:acylphosphatase
MVQYEIIVKGRVQGVGYRYYAVQQAQLLGVKGYVRNQADNSVVVVAQADEEVIQTFIDYLYIGPTRARVDHISKIKIDYSSYFDNFSVKY